MLTYYLLLDGLRNGECAHECPTLNNACQMVTQECGIVIHECIWDAFAKRVWVQMHRKDGRRVLRNLVVEGCKMSDFGKLRSLCP